MRQTLSRFRAGLRSLRTALRGTPDRLGTVPKEYIAKFLPAAPVIVEAGGHNGNDTLDMLRVWPKAQVHVFEPVPQLLACLQANVRRFGNVHAYGVALGHFNGEASFHVSQGGSDGSSSLLVPKLHLREHPEVLFVEMITVPVVTLDTWAEQHHVERVDFLWLDQQGAELATLQGAQRLLPTVSAIYAEVFLEQSYENVPLYPEVRTWLGRHGFRVEREALPWPSGGNVLFVRA